MEIVYGWKEKGRTISEPYKRNLKIIFAPDRRNVSEITFSLALVYPRSKTDYHAHDRPELIYIVSGRGLSFCNGEEIEVKPDMVLWVRAGEKHQLINTGDESLKLATVFVPAYTAEELLGTCQKAAQEANRVDNQS